MAIEARRADVAPLRGAAVGRPAPSPKVARDVPYLAFGIGLLTIVSVAYRWYQGAFAHTTGLDSNDPAFQTYWMTLLYAETAVFLVVAAVLWSWIWRTRDRNLDNLSPRTELQRWASFVIWLTVYTWAVYWGGSFFAEQDASWHQVVIRDTSFTPSHIVLFYGSMPIFIIIGVASWLWARTRLPTYAKGFSIPLTLAVVGPFMILPNVGLNEWGHAFWISEELFVAPLHWGFVVLGWTGLCLGGVLMQVVFRCSRLLSAVSEESRAQAVA